jgi:O-antigen ligase
MAVPLCWCSRSFTQSRFLKALLLCMCLFSICAVIMTNSRGCSLALGAVLLLLLKRSNNRIASVIVLVGVAAGAIYLIRDEYIARMQTLQHVDEEASAASRIDQDKTVMAVWKDYPIVGVGFGGLNYLRLSSIYSNGKVEGHMAHNSYLQMLVDSGPFAFLIYVGLVWGTFVWLVKKGKHVEGDVRAVTEGMSASLLAFGVGGTFYSCQRLDLTYMLILCAGAMQLMKLPAPVPDDASLHEFAEAPTDGSLLVAG